MNLNIERLVVKNFLAWKDFSIKFTDGLTVIQGRNGVGKSAILDALTVAFFNKPIRNIVLRDLINRDANKMIIEVFGELNGSKFYIDYVRQLTEKGTTYRINFHYKNEIVENINIMQEILKKEGLTYQRWLAMSAITPQTIPFSVGDYKYTKNLIETFLNFEEFDEYAAKIGDIHKKYVEHYKRLHTALTIARTNIRQYSNNIKRLKSKLFEYNTIMNKSNLGAIWNRIQELEKQIEYIRGRIDKLNNVVAQYQVLTGKKNVLSEKKKTYDTLRKQYLTQKHKLEKEYKQMQYNVHKAKENKCPTCGQPLKDMGLLNKFMVEYQNIESELKIVLEKLTDVTKKLGNTDTKLQETNEQLAIVSKEYTEYTNFNNQLQKLYAELNVKKQELKKYKQNPEQLSIKIQEITKEIETNNKYMELFTNITIPNIEQILVDVDNIKSLLYTIKQELSSKKKRSLLVKDALTYIFDHVNNILHEFNTDDNFSLHVDMNPDFSKYVVAVKGNVAKQVDGLSAGQNKLVSVLFSLALALLYRSKYGNINILFLDDIFDTLDYNRIQQLIKFLSKLPIKKIYILSHMDNLVFPDINSVILKRED